MNNNQQINPMPYVILGIILLIFFVGGGMYGCPKYDVWQSGLKGQAELARAEQNRQIRVNEAKARNDAAKWDKKTTVTQAEGVAEANIIIGTSLKDNDGYLRWLYIDMLRETGGQGRETIYIATEAGLPILEANRMNQPGPRVDK